MRVRFLLFAASLVAGAFVASEAQAEPGRATGNVNLRQCASTRCARILTIPAGAVVEVLGREGAWFRVEYRRVVGYAYASYIDVRGYYVAPPLPPPVYYPEPYYYEYEPFPLPRIYRPYRQPQRHDNRDHRGNDHSHDHGQGQSQDQGSGGFPHEGGDYRPPHNGNWPPHQNDSEPVQNEAVAPPPTLPAPQGAPPPQDTQLQQPQEFQHHHEGGGQAPRQFVPQNGGDGGAGGQPHEHRRHEGGGNCAPGDPNCQRR